MTELRGRPNPKHDSSARLRLDELEMLRGEVSRMVALASRDPRNLREAILRHLPHGIIVCDAEGNITMRNAAAERIWPAGANAARISDWDKCRAFYSDGRSYGPEDWSLARCLRRLEVVPTEEVWVERADGLRSLLLGSCSPLRGTSGEVRGAIFVFADIAEFHSLAAAERASRDQIAKLQSVTSALAETRLPSEVARVVVEKMSAVLRAGKSFVATLSPDGKDLCLLGHAGLKASSPERFARLPVEMDAPLAHAFRTGHSVWISSREQYLREFPSVAASDETDTMSVACAPLIVGGQKVGAIGFAFLEPRTFDALERSLVEELAKQAAITLERARLYESEQNARRRLEILARTARRFAETALDLEALIKSVVSELGAALDSAVALTMFETTEFTHGAVYHPVPEAQELMRSLGAATPASEMFGIRAKAVNTGESQLVREIDPASHASGGCASWLEQYPVYAAMCVPLRSRGDVVGTLTALRTRPGESYTTDDLLLLEELATRAQVALENARLFAEARRAEERFNLALEAGRMGAWEFEMGTGHVMWTATLEELHGIPVGSFGGTFEDYQRDIHPDDRERVLETISRSSSGAGEHHLVYRIIRPDGAVRWLDATGRLFRDSAGNPVRMLGVCSDVTERVEAEEQRRGLLKRTEEAVRARDDLLAMVSHDLRNPLSAIAMTSAMLSDAREFTLERRQAQAGRIRRAAKRMEELIANLLDASSIEAGSFAVRPSPVDVGTLVTESVEFLFAIAAEKNIKIEKRISDTSMYVNCDRGRVSQVLGNLIGNALKFGPRESVVLVEARRVGDTVEFAVVDSGPGIAPEYVDLVFDRYWRGKQSGRAGTGLGLFIARGIVHAHQGRVWLESIVGQGSSFHFTLPLVIPPFVGTSA